MKKLALFFFACQLWSFWLISTVYAQTDPFYKGKTIRVVVGFPAGGIVDLWARFIAQYMGRYIPGTPDLIVQGSPQRNPNLPEVPTIYELMEKHRTADQIKRLAIVLLSPGALGRPMIGPPNMPAERIKRLRDTYAKTLSDPDFLADAKKRQWEVEHISGEELEPMARKSMAQPADTVERLKKILGE